MFGDKCQNELTIIFDVRFPLQLSINRVLKYNKGNYSNICFCDFVRALNYYVESNIIGHSCDKEEVYLNKVKIVITFMANLLSDIIRINI